MGTMVYFLFWVMQDLYHQPYQFKALLPNLGGHNLPSSQGFAWVTRTPSNQGIITYLLSGLGSQEVSWFREAAARENRWAA